MSKHTPGPWATSKHGTPAAFPQFGVYQEGACNDHVTVKGENAQADAALIAAAPDLLEACQGLLEVFAGDMDCEDMATIQHARAVIARTKYNT